MPHSIPSTTHKINTTIAGEQHSLFLKGRRSCSAAHGKCAWLDLCQEQAEAVLWPFLCDCAGIWQGFLRMKCPSPTRSCVPGKGHQAVAAGIIVLFSMPAQNFGCDLPPFPAWWLPKSHPHWVWTVWNSLTSVHLVSQDTLKRIKPAVPWPVKFCGWFLTY